MQTEPAKLSWAWQRGRLSLAWGGACRIELRGVAPRVRLHHRGKLIDWIPDALADDGGRFRASRADPALELEWTCREEGNTFTLRLEIENRSDEPLRVEELCPFTVAPGGETILGAGTDRMVCRSDADRHHRRGERVRAAAGVQHLSDLFPGPP